MCKLAREKEKGKEAVAAAGEEAAALRARVGIEARYKSLPSTSYEGASGSKKSLGSWSCRVSQHVKSVLDGRLDTPEGARAVAKGIAASGDDAVTTM